MTNFTLIRDFHVALNVYIPVTDRTQEIRLPAFIIWMGSNADLAMDDFHP